MNGDAEWGSACPIERPRTGDEFATAGPFVLGGIASLVLPQPWDYTPLFPANEVGTHQRTIERRASEQVMSVAGRVLRTSSGTKPIAAAYGLFANLRSHCAQMSSRVSAARKLATTH